MTMLDRFNWIGFRAKEVLQAYIEINTSGRLEDLGIRHMEDCTLEFFCDAEFHRDQETEAAKLIQALRDSNAGHDHHTTEIQRIFNGFYICKHSICMSDHKGFLQSALQQQEVVKKLLRSKYRILCRAQQEKAEKTLKDQLEKWIDSKHHLIKGVFDSRVVGGGEQNSFVEDVLLAAQKRRGTMAKAQMLLRRQIQELGAQVKTSKPVNTVMRSGSYQSAYDRRIALQNIEDSKIINTEKFIYQVGPKHEKQIVATGIPFGLQVPYEHKKFLRKQDKLKYAAMCPKTVEAPWKVMFPSGHLFDKLYSPQPEHN